MGDLDPDRYTNNGMIGCIPNTMALIMLDSAYNSYSSNLSCITAELLPTQFC